MTTKFNIGSIVYIIDNNKVKQFKVESIFIQDNIKYHLTPTVGGLYKTSRYENEVFKTKEELINSL